jgi:hypothetical protein
MRRCLTLFALALTVPLCADQTDYAIGNVSAPWLNVEASPRAAALGGQAPSMNGDTLIALQDNPAGLAGLGSKEGQVALAQNNWVQSTSLQQVAVGYGLGPAGGLGLGFTYMNYGSLDRYVVLPGGGVAQNGSFNPYGYALKLGYGLDLGYGISVGVEGKYLGENLDSDSASTLSGDLGVRYTWESLSVGLSGSDLFGSLYDSSLPAEIKLGADYGVDLSKGTLKLLAGTAIPTVDDGATSYGGGLEYGYAQLFWGRLGYQAQSNASTGGISAGFGVKYRQVSLDYAFVSLGDLGSSNQFALAATF